MTTAPVRPVFAKAQSPMESKPAGNVKFARFVQPKNAPSQMSDSGPRATERSTVLLANWYAVIAVAVGYVIVIDRRVVKPAANEPVSLPLTVTFWMADAPDKKLVAVTLTDPVMATVTSAVRLASVGAKFTEEAAVAHPSCNEVSALQDPNEVASIAVASPLMLTDVRPVHPANTPVEGIDKEVEGDPVIVTVLSVVSPLKVFVMLPTKLGVNVSATV
jgi:hypothetical protein